MTRRRLAGGAFSFLLLAVAFLPPAGAVLLAQSPGVSIERSRADSRGQDNERRSWFRNYDYGVEVDGSRDPDIGLFQVIGKPYMLIYGPALNPSWVLTLRTKEVRPVTPSEISVKSDMEIELAESSFLNASPAPWAYDGETAVVFYGGQKRIRIARMPPLEGVVTPEQIYAVNPLYRIGKEKYVPEQTAIARLKKVASPCEIEVWFGTWCPHCQRIVPRFIKVMEAVANPNVRATYHGVPRDISGYKPASTREVEGLPTFIMLRDGREFRRLRGGGESSSLEDELADLLSPPAGG